MRSDPLLQCRRERRFLSSNDRFAKFTSSQALPLQPCKHPTHDFGCFDPSGYARREAHVPAHINPPHCQLAQSTGQSACTHHAVCTQLPIPAETSRNQLVKGYSELAHFKGDSPLGSKVVGRVILHLILEGSWVSVIRRSGLLPLLTIRVTDISPVKGII